MGNFTVFPTGQNVAISGDQGSLMSEAYLMGLLNCFFKVPLQGHGFVNSGLMVMSTGTQLVVQAGDAIVHGYYVSRPSNYVLSGSLIPNATNHIFLYVTVLNSTQLVDNVDIHIATTNSLPTVTGKTVYGIKLATMGMGNGQTPAYVLSYLDKRPWLSNTVTTPSWEDI